MRYLLLSFVLVAGQLPAQRIDDRKVLERAILKQLVEINTSDSAGHTREAAEAMRNRLLAAGFPSSDVHVIGRTPKYQNLVARYRGRGTGKKPILLMAHLDVVDARREDWTFDPYEFRELDGYYYGRGTMDDKFGAAMLVSLFLRYKSEGYTPDRDLIMVLTADEETTGDGMHWLVQAQRALIDAEYALNTDAGGGELRDGRPVAFTVQTAEKTYVTYQLEVRNKGGHSSQPRPDNAIASLSRGLTRLGEYEFPVRLNEITRASFAARAKNQPPAVAADMRTVAQAANLSDVSVATAVRRLSAEPAYNAMLRTTCAATRLFAGHADNALPQLARATVNCRVLPDASLADVQATLTRVVADTSIHVTATEPGVPSPASPLRPDVMGPVERLASEMWPGAAIGPEMSTGGTDGLETRLGGIPTYGMSAVFETVDGDRSHGRDERIGVRSFHDAAEFWYRLVKRLTGAGAI